MRKKVGLAAIASALIALVVGGASLAGGPATDQTITLTTREGKGKFIDVERNKRDSVGDTALFTLLLSQNGTRVGTAHIKCTAHFGGPALCIANLRLRGRGDIELQGMAGDEPFTVAVTGGTGAFEGVGGEAHVLRNDRLVLHLTR